MRMFGHHTLVYAKGQTMAEYALLGSMIFILALGGIAALGGPFANRVFNMTTQSGGATQPAVANVQAANNVVASVNQRYNDLYGAAINTPGTNYANPNTVIQYTWDGSILNGAGYCTDPCDPNGSNTGGGF